MSMNILKIQNSTRSTYIPSELSLHTANAYTIREPGICQILSVSFHTFETKCRLTLIATDRYYLLKNSKHDELTPNKNTSNLVSRSVFIKSNKI